jgi:hypothetical protein
MESFINIGVVKNDIKTDYEKLAHFENTILDIKNKGTWSKEEIVDLFNEMIPNFSHKETGKYLDAKM